MIHFLCISETSNMYIVSLRGRA